MQEWTLATGIIIVASAITVIIHKGKRKFELGLKELTSIVEMAENTISGESKYEEIGISTTSPVQDAIILEAYKILEQRRKEREQLRKWIHYATHAKKFRIRKKYQNRIRKHYECKGMNRAVTEGLKCPAINVMERW